jgi:hypothetical protein
MWVSIESEAACSAALQQALHKYGVLDTDTLQAVLESDAAGFARALCTSLQTEGPSCSSTGTMTDAAVSTVEAGMQTCLTGDAVDTSTAEAMVAEAMCMLDAALEREQLAETRTLVWQGRAEFAARLLRAEEERTDGARSALQTAKSLEQAEQAARQMVEQLLAMEAALADAAVERSLNEYRARCRVETELALWKALASGRGGRGGRGRSPPQPPPQPQPTPQSTPQPTPPPPSQPPPPPPLPELIRGSELSLLF